MHGLPVIAAALRSERGRLLEGCLEALDDRVLAQLDDPEGSIERVVDAAIAVIDSGRFDVLLNCLEEIHTAQDADRRSLFEAVVVGVCSRLDHLSIDGRDVHKLCETMKSRLSMNVASAAAAEEPSESLTAVLATLKARDVATCSHSQATASWARRLSVAMGLPAGQVAIIESAALLHDVGKIATPDAVLLKPGPLTPDEWVVMREHAAAGEKLLLQIPSLARYARIVRAHHERFDGRGYPDGLAAHEIPFESRLIAVVDSFHAMISARPYRTPLSPRVALETLRKGSGSQWEPSIVNAMIALVERVPQTRRLATGT